MPNMFVEAVIYGGPKRDVLTIPREALIETGKQRRVIVALGEKHFKPREVMVGVERGDWVEITEGLETGDCGKFNERRTSNVQHRMLNGKR